VKDHLSQYATLKAIGYSIRFLIGVTVQEAAYLGVLGFFPGLLVSVGGYAALHATTGMLMKLSAGRIALEFVLTVLMCAVSGVLAIRRVDHGGRAEAGVVEAELHEDEDDGEADAGQRRGGAHLVVRDLQPSQGGLMAGRRFFPRISKECRGLPGGSQG
jgi:hypothetical protein